MRSPYPQSHVRRIFQITAITFKNIPSYLAICIAALASSSTAFAQSPATPAIAVSTSSTNNSYRTVTLSDTTPGATIHYTTDGTIAGSTSPTYSVPFSVTSTTLIDAIATQSGTNSVPTQQVTVSPVGQVSYPETFPDFTVSGVNSAGVIDVTNNSVTGTHIKSDGLTDDSCYLQTLLSSNLAMNTDPITGSGGTLASYPNSYPWQNPIFYFPNGTYLLSSASCLPLVKNYSDGMPAPGMNLMGESETGVVLKVAYGVLPNLVVTGNINGTENTVTNVTVGGVATTSGLYVNQHVKGSHILAGTTIVSVDSATDSIVLSLTPTAAVTESLTVFTPILFTQSANNIVSGAQVQVGNQAYFNVIENLTVDLETSGGNPAAIGISYLASNSGAIRHVLVKGSPEATGTGIDITRPFIGPALVENVTVSGFTRGIDVANTGYGVTLEHVTLADQVSSAIYNADNLITGNAILIETGQTGAVAVTNSTLDGYVILANSNISQTGAAEISNTNGVVSLVNTTFASQQSNLGTNTAGVPINGKLVGSTWTAKTTGGTGGTGGFMLPLLYDTPMTTDDPAAQWTAVASSAMTAEWIQQTTGNLIAANGSTVTTLVDATSAINTAMQACESGTSTSTVYFPHGIYYVNSPILIPSCVDRIVGMNSTIRVIPADAGNFPSGTGLFQASSTTCGTSCPYVPTVTIERIAVDGKGSGLSGLYAVQANRGTPPTGEPAQSVVLRDVRANYSALINQHANGGAVYLENSGGPILIDGPNWVMSRQLNTEGDIGFGAFITNQGAPLWILGYKTEGADTLLFSPNTTTPAQNEIIGGYVFPITPGRAEAVTGTTCAEADSASSSTSATAATFILSPGNTLEASFIEEVVRTPTNDYSYPFYYADYNGGYGNGINCVAGAGTGATGHYAATVTRTPITRTPEYGFIIDSFVP